MWVTASLRATISEVRRYQRCVVPPPPGQVSEQDRETADYTHSVPPLDGGQGYADGIDTSLDSINGHDDDAAAVDEEVGPIVSEGAYSSLPRSSQN